MNKTDAYNEFDPTQSQGSCGCSGVGFDIETLTWKEQKAPPPTDPCAEVKAQLAQAQADKSTVEAKLAETQAKLDECEASKCPEATVISLGDETVFTGTSCDTMTGLGGDVVTGTEDVATPDPLGSKTVAELERDP